jgi:hypothetical protein
VETNFDTKVLDFLPFQDLLQEGFCLKLQRALFEAQIAANFYNLSTHQLPCKMIEKWIWSSQGFHCSPLDTGVMSSAKD